MPNGKKTILISFLIFAVCTSVGSGEIADNNPVERVLHFPEDRSLGELYIWDAGAELKVDVHLRFGTLSNSWKYFSEAKGDVIVPAGKRLGLNMSNASLRNLSELSKLGDDIYFLMVNDKRMRGTNLYKLVNMKGLKILGTEYSNVTDEELKIVKEVKTLEILCLPETITNVGLAQLKKLKSLKALYLSGDGITDEGLAELVETTQLKNVYIRLPCKSGITFLKKIARLKSLRYHINVNSKTYTGEVAEYLEGASALVWLHLSYCPVKDKELLLLSKLPKLEELGLFNVPILDNDLACLQNLPSLKKLDIGDYMHDTKITDEGMVHVGELKQLEFLRIPSSITDKGLAKLTGLSNLERLEVMNTTGVSDDGVAHISKLNKLKTLLLRGHNRTNQDDCVLTDKALEHISKLKELEELRLNGSKITDVGFAHLKNLKFMKNLRIGGSKITLSGVSSVVRHMPDLTTLSIRPVLQDGSVLDISGLTKLRSLEVGTPRKSGTTIKDEDLACLENLTDLDNLFITQIHPDYTHDIGDKGVSYLKNLTNMRLLWIGGPRMTDVGLSYLKNMKQMWNLSVAGDFTDEGLKFLEGMKNLERLRIYTNNELSQRALKRLKRKLPRLRIFYYGKNPDNEES